MGRHWKVAADAFLSSHLGIISAGTLIGLGCPKRTLANLVADGELITTLPGVFRSAQWPFGREQKMGAVCARNPAAMIAFTTAGQEWWLRRMGDPMIHALVTHGRSPEMEGVIVHRCRRIDPIDIVQRPDGIRLTSPPRTIFDSADMIGEEATASVLEQLLNENRLTFGTISDTVQRLYHPNRPGSKTMLAVIRSRPVWRAALQSDLEVRVLEEMARQQLPVPATQFRMRLPGRDRDIAIDFAWPNVKLAVEVDHPAWHDGALDSHADKGRDRKLTTIGWTPTRITDVDVNGGLSEAVADIGLILTRLINAAV
ncbi:MAG: type IV toxin-antitoxin system AbiEi family antitoxin domain-containing protein [Ilumatobacteraceae bacterium]